jgi:hypothetical protein
VLIIAKEKLPVPPIYGMESFLEHLTTLYNSHVSIVLFSFVDCRTNDKRFDLISTMAAHIVTSGSGGLRRVGECVCLGVSG